MTWTVGTLEKKQKREREENPEVLPSVDEKRCLGPLKLNSGFLYFREK